MEDVKIREFIEVRKVISPYPSAILTLRQNVRFLEDEASLVQPLDIPLFRELRSPQDVGSSEGQGKEGKESEPVVVTEEPTARPAKRARFAEPTLSDEEVSVAHTLRPYSDFAFLCR